MMLDYPLIEALAAVVREGSFEKAARVLHLTPSAVSQRVKLLEERVGKVLVARGQPCTATEVGGALCRHAEQVALLEHELSGRLPELGAVQRGPLAPPTLRIAVNADSAATWFMPALNRFCSHHDVLFDLVFDDQDHTAALLRSGSVHGAVTTLAAPVQGCRAQKLGTMRFLSTCSPSFWKRHFSGGVNRAAFAGAPCLVFNAKDALQTTFMRKVLRAEPNVPSHRLPSSTAFVEASLGGLGWAMNPELLVREHLRTGALVEVAPGRSVDVELYWQSWRLSSKLIEALTEEIVSAARAQLR